MTNKIIGAVLLLGMISVTACQQASNTTTESEQVVAGAVMDDGEPRWGLMMAASGEGEQMMEIIDAFNNMDVEGVFAHSADTVRMSSADGSTIQMTREAMSGWFASMDSVKWNVGAVIPVQREEGTSVSVIVDGMQTDYYKDGTVESYRLMERFVFTDGVMTRVYQYTAAMPEESAE
jgi:hypothetical protein